MYNYYNLMQSLNFDPYSLYTQSIFSGGAY
nr:MAG TPA: hypothetical protein [Caudoviricetes sp.]